MTWNKSPTRKRVIYGQNFTRLRVGLVFAVFALQVNSFWDH